MNKRVISAGILFALLTGISLPAQAAGIEAAGLASGTGVIVYALHTIAGNAAAPAKQTASAAGAESADKKQTGSAVQLEPAEDGQIETPVQNEPAATNPPTQRTREMGLVAVERNVRENNPTIRTLNYTAAGIGSGGKASLADNGELAALVGQYSAAVAELQQAYEAAEDEAVKQAYALQLGIHQANLASLQGTIAMPAMTAAMTQMMLEDAEYGVRQQAGNVAKQLCYGAESMLIGMKSLAVVTEDLTRTLASLDRTIEVMKIQKERGMVSQLQFDNVCEQRRQLSVQIESLQNQQQSLGSNLALMCGYEADMCIVPGNLSHITLRNIQEMDYETDLAVGLKNSYELWSKKNAVMQAGNKRDIHISGTVDAYEAAKKDAEATEEALKQAFKAIYDAVADQKLAVDAAQTAYTKAQSDLSISKTKYELGAISHMDYLAAQDTCAAAKNAVETAHLNLISAYRAYTWAKQGLISTGAAGGAS